MDTLENKLENIFAWQIQMSKKLEEMCKLMHERKEFERYHIDMLVLQFDMLQQVGMKFEHKLPKLIQRTPRAKRK